MQDFVAHDWKQRLDSNGLGTFESIWRLDIGWFEEPNKRRGGWSGVSRIEISLPEGGTAGLYVKRQEDHTSRRLSHPFSRQPTFAIEFRNLQRLRSSGIPTLEPVYFAVRKLDGKLRAILITVELEGFTSLAACLEYWQRHGWPDRQLRTSILTTLAGVTRNLHRHHMQHNCLFPKHVFIGQAGAGTEIRLIDLEKAKWKFSMSRAGLRDLDTLNRHAPLVSHADRMRFLLAYYGKSRLDADTRAIWKRLDNLYKRKLQKRSPV